MLDLVDHFIEHDEYYAIMEEYYHRYIFKEAVKYLDKNPPEWKTNLGLGHNAASYIKELIDFLEYLEDRDEYTYQQMVDKLHEEISNSYPISKSFHELFLIDKLHQDFTNAYENELDEIEELTNEDYKVAYNKLYEDFKKDYMNITTYSFEKLF